MENLRTSVASHIRGAQTPAESLRQILSQLEAEIGKMGFAQADEPTTILLLLDQADALQAELEHQEVDLAGERGRLQTITEQFKRKGKVFLKRVGGAEALQRLREEHAPPAESWWWFVDDYLEQQRRESRRRTLRSVAIAAGAFAVIAILYAIFLAPDEATRQRLRYEQAAEQALSEGDAATALVEVEQALEVAPDNAELLVLKGIIQELLGQDASAEATYASAEALLGDRLTFLTTRAEANMRASRPDAAREDALAIIALDPDSATAHYLLGNAEASLGNYFEAVEYFEQAADLARASGETQLEGMARVQLANVMMLVSMPQSPKAATPTP